MEEIGKTNEELSIELDTLKHEYQVLKAKYEKNIVEYKIAGMDLVNSEEKSESLFEKTEVEPKVSEEQIKSLFVEYIRMYASRDDLLTTYFSDNFSGFTGGGDFLVKDKKEWIDITRQDFSQVKESLRIEHKDLSIQRLSNTIAVTTSFFTIHLPIKDHILSRETARLVLIFRKESEGWKITHSSISIPYHLVREGEVYPLKDLEERNRFLEEMVLERTAQISRINRKLEKKNEELVNEIASRKLVESELLESETRLQSLVSNLEAGVVVHVADTSIVMNNSRASELLGLTNDQMKGKAAIDPAWKFVNEDHTPIPLNEYPVNRILNLKQPIKNQIMGVHHPDKDGFVWAEVNGFPVLNINGEISEIVISFIDITERKKAEEALRMSESRFRIMLQDIENIAVQGYSLDGTTQYWNHASERLYGYTVQEAIGCNLLDLIIPAEMREGVKQAMNYMAESGKPIPASELLLRRKDDSTVPVFSSHVIVQIPGKQQELFCIDIDLSERKQVEAELEIYHNHLEDLVKTRTNELTRIIEREEELKLILQKALEKEKEVNEMKSRFISTTSHEFRTPLTSILSSSGLLERYSNKWDEDKKKEHFERINNSVSYLVKLLDDILTISHADSGRIYYDPALIDLEHLVKECVVDAQNLSASHHIKLSFKPSQTEYLLDLKLMRFILNNLLSNAIKYSPNAKDVGLTISTIDNNLIFEVADKGIGIPQEEIVNIFESFYRTKNAGDIKGTGLGLAIVKRAVDLHGGEILVSSILNKGTTFIVKIPVC